MGGNHSAKECHSNSRCRICKQKHHSLLHPEGKNTTCNEGDNKPNKSIVTPSNNPSNHSASLVSCFSTGKIFQQVLLATAVVKVTSRNGEDYKLRALIDQGSQSSFVTESAVQYLGLKKKPTINLIAGLGGEKDVVSKAAVQFTLKSMYDPTVKISVNAHVIKCITSPLPAEKIEPMEWLQQKKLLQADPEYHTPNRIDILLGAEVYTKILRAGIKRGPLGTPLAQATCLGWILSGVIESNTKPASHINVMHCHCTSDLKRFWELEADIQLPKDKLFTDEEKFCEQHFKTNTRRESDGRYIVRLPFKVEAPQVTSSRDIAEHRLKSLERKLEKDKTLRVKYQEVIDEYLKLNHMELISPEEIDNPKAIYLPHHAVVRDDKETTKVRIVYDASCKGKNNMSLNDQLAIGPTLQPELRHIIMRWRLTSICMSADIVKMYRQVKTDNRDNDFQRILWRENPNSEIKHYKLTRVTFGTASAPYLAVKTLQQVAHDDGADYPMAAETILKSFYVDDFLSGCENVEQGYKIFTQMNELLGRAKFKLQKWNSNNNELLELMKREERDKKAGKELEMEEELKIKEDELIKIMGLTWNRRDDTFRYSVNLPTLQQPVTKRMIISDISRLYDPLGWVGPSVIIAKIMIQKLWLSGLSWDEIVPNNLLNEWLTYREEQLKLREIRIPRWIGTHTDDHEVEIHGFCDASKSAYAAVVAIHLEVVSDLTTEGFLQAFKRTTYDNGTNSIGASGELKKRAISERKQMLAEVAASLATNDCEWHFIPAHSPNFGGLWEAGVKSVKNHLKRIIGNSTLTYEEMATVLSQIEACLHSCPLSVIPSQSEIGNILTPGHFLIGEPLLTAPDHDVGSFSVGSLRRWQYTQRMLQSFWQQWSDEYLNKFLLRYKWNKHNPQPKLNDVVVVKEDGLPPSRWLFGKVIATYPGVDDIVRVVDIKTKGGVIKRPTQKLCILPVAE
ncbi:uncharacterized protein LOC124534969 [Vanessa cardui]|uniref:uncharacterized protein LOC124534969 n=1 Tax=Vanessa cardui TaxID=171605 RepID=UPI001F14095B|nr:uncharacterized protein LOC124534969 [Vanessa cardui]